MPNETEVTRPKHARPGRPGYDRDSMLRVIIEVFAERGYEATSLEHIAKRLGLSKSAIYHHFTSKEEMLELALDQSLGRLEGVFDRAEALEASAASRITTIVREAVLVACSTQPSLSLLLRLRGNSEVERGALERRRAFDAKLRRAYEQALDEGSLKPGVSPSLAERLTFGLINSTVEWYNPAGKVTPEQLADAVLRYVYGVLEAPPRAQSS